MKYTPEKSWSEKDRHLESINKEYDPVRAAKCYFSEENYMSAKHALLNADSLSESDINLLNTVYERLIQEMYDNFKESFYGSTYNIDDILEEIECMPQITEPIQSIKTEIEVFLDQYGKWIGYYGTNSSYIGIKNYDDTYFVRIYPTYDEGNGCITLSIIDHKILCDDIVISDNRIEYTRLLDDFVIEYVSETEIKRQNRSLYKYDTLF